MVAIGAVFAPWALGSSEFVDNNPAGNPKAAVDFNMEVRPILARHCLACHGLDAESREADLRLDHRESLVEDRGGYRVVAPGNPEESELLFRVRSHEDFERMPPPESGRVLRAEEIEILERWIREGATFADHWSFLAPVRPELPAPNDWARQPFDAFVLERMHEHGLAPAEEADPATLLRRVSLDLVGLPPSPEDVLAFLDASDRDRAYETYVDELLRSPAFGEHWAAMWLDLARYADSSGYGSDPLREIWRYRDWVIEAFDRNLPFDQFTREQMAGDLLPGATTEQILATAFHRNTMTNTEGGTDDEEFRVAAVKDRVNTTMQVWMGLTAGCAQCHTHKYDPISQEEYYRLFAFFDQTADRDRNDDSPRLATPTVEQRALQQELEARIAELDAKLAAPSPELREGQRRWEQRHRESARHRAHWIPDLLQTEHGSELRALETAESAAAVGSGGNEGVIVAEGPAPAEDEYRLRGPLHGAEPIRALDFEALVDPALPRSGPGRSGGNGNFVLSELRLRVWPQSDVPPLARTVRIELPGVKRILSLAEVEVFSGGENIALEGTATQSSVAYSGPAPLAIDGNTSGRYDEQRSVTHCAIEDDPWWQVDLGGEFSIESLRVWNRTDGDLHRRLDGARVVLLDGEGGEVYRNALVHAPEVSREIEPATSPIEIPLERPSASFEQAGFLAVHAVDGNPKTGWAIGPRQGSSHTARFATGWPLEPSEYSAAEVVLEQRHGQQHTLGRFRISFSGADASLDLLPTELHEVLTLVPEQRTEQHQRELAARYREVAPELDDLRVAKRAAQKQREELQIPTTPVLRELGPQERRTTHVLLKGNFLTPGEQVGPGTPASLHPWRDDLPSNRLGLAEWLVDPANPLTARVQVNRFWARLFGRGLVETEEDLGTQGTLPSHPRVLDWLAVEFRESGWDVKALLRRLVLSSTYRQSSHVDRDDERDPENVWLARGPRFRLSAEQVRDMALAVSGLLSDKRFGPSVYPPQPEGLWQAAFNGQRTWPTSQGEDRYRRGLYTFLRRTVPYPSMATFDAPSREVCTPRRIRTLTPLQLFVTWNDPVFVELAQAFARRVCREAEGTRARLERAWWLALQRPPEDRELEVLEALLLDERESFEARPDDAARFATEPLGPLPDGLEAVEAAAWTVVCNVLLNHHAALTKS